MPCATLDELPPPPPGKTGWPWTKACEPLAASRPDGGPWPRISIATPSFNQGDYIEETIRSILLQGYPDLEYFVMDGGSTDPSVEVIRKYAPWITSWRSAPDKGQADAINLALAEATGEVFHFINSDDVLAPNALAQVGALAGNGASIAGAVLEFEDETTHLVRNMNLSTRRMLYAFDRTDYCTYHQPGVWMDRQHLVDIGGFDIDLHFCFDFHLAVRYFERWPLVRYTDKVLVHFRLHAAAKTTGGNDRVINDHLVALEDLAKRLHTPEMRRQALIGRSRTLWPRKVQDIRNSGRTPIAKALSLAGHMLAQPRVSANRFTFGALRQEVVAAVRPGKATSPGI